MDNDDQQIGRVLSRREVLTLLGTAGAALLVGCGPTQSSQTGSTTATVTTTAPAAEAATPALNAEAATAVAMTSDPTAAATASAEMATAAAGNVAAVPACVVRPEVTEGPYYVDEDLDRSDIRSDPTTGTVKEGTPLVLTFNISQVSSGSCTPLSGAIVNVWHCDAVGAYSDVSDPGFNTEGQKWLRGSQTTDANGQASFTTIYPGWYSGRAVHIHYKVRPNETKVFTSQLFFDDTLSQQVLTQAPYVSKSNTPDTLNSTDSIYQELMLLTTTKTDQGYAAMFDIGMDLSTVGTGQSNGGGPGGSGGPPPGRATATPQP
ncbi:MAG: intradiol ring-cleavage dioxygenase [Roseiflexaceae bacterium]